MKIFSECARTDLDEASYAESTYAYLNRSARPEMAAVREILNQWFERYPHNAASGCDAAQLRKALLHRFKSRRDRQQREAFWELYLHESLVRAGGTVVVRPDTPDFEVTFGTTRFFLEATVRGLSEDEAAAENRLSCFHDRLNAMDIHPWMIDVTVSADPKKDAPFRAFRHDIESWLATLHIDSVRAEVERSRAWDALPAAVFHHDGWCIEVHAIPKDADAPSSDHPSAIGGWGPGEMVRVVNSERLVESLSRKADRLTNLNGPVILAVLLDRNYGHDHQVESALFGSEQTTVLLDPKHLRIAGTRETRAMDGLWSFPERSGARIDAVLAGVRLDPFAISRVSPTLWTNPWRHREPLRVPDTLPWRHVWVEPDRAVRWTEFPSPSPFFDLEPQWPEVAAHV